MFLPTMVVCKGPFLFCLLQWPRLLLFFLFLTIPQATSLNFSFPNITTQQRNVIITDGRANITGEGIQVTQEERSDVTDQRIGRVRYVEALQLWDSDGNQADFTTNFSFVIDSLGNSAYGDGFAFFLIPDLSNFGDITISQGGALGLPVDSETSNARTQFVAVEFDTNHNDWDPDVSPATHVGIDVNSLQSVNTSIWYNNITHGRENEAWIAYNSNSNILSVGFTGSLNDTVTRGSLSYTINLSSILPQRVVFGFSASTGAFFERHNVKSWSFSSNLHNVTRSPVPPSPSQHPNETGENRTGLVVGLSVGSCVLVGGLCLIALFLWKRNRGKEDVLESELISDYDFEKGIGPKRFSYSELAQCTDNFSEEQKLGEGGFGGVYRGLSRELASYIAVKRVSRGSKQGPKEYASEVKIISRIRHRNLVQLIGWCHEKNELLLVYEFMPNGSLDSHLFKGKSLLTWAMRYKIVQGLASALLYLHEEWEQCVLHRDIKASNIMLDSNFNTKLGDFGLARLVDHERGSQTTVLAGTMGYMAPECVITGRASKESDVFSFGIVALEIACGRKPIDTGLQEHHIRMVEWVWELYGTEKLLEAADPKLCGDFDEQEMTCLMIVGLWCAHPDYNLRPSVREAIQVLNFEAPLPILPSKMPMPTYWAPPVTTSSYSATVTEGSQAQYSGYSGNTDSSKFTSSSATSSPSASLLHTT